MLFSGLYVVHPRCVYAIDGGVGPSNTTGLCSYSLQSSLNNHVVLINKGDVAWINKRRSKSNFK
jgi:hypothetical protein